MNNPSSKLCPKCGKPYTEIRKIDCNYDLYVHDFNVKFKGLTSLKSYCVITKGYNYNHPEPDVTGKPLNPGYRTLKP